MLSRRSLTPITNYGTTEKIYHYDGNGNTSDGAGRTFGWTVDNRVAFVTNASGTTNMNYDYTGARVKKWGPLGLTVYPFAGYEVGPDGTKIKFFKAGNELLAARQVKTTGASTKLFYHNDHLGGINVITDDVVSHNGARQQLIEYDPWGKISRSEGTNLESERRFTGQILDPEFGLYYYGARYYDPELARFISPDPIIPSPGDPQTLNRYTYVRNNPVKYIDPTGHSFWSDLGNFFKNFFKSLPALITGVVVAWATWGIGIPILAGMLGGMAAAAVNTAMNGGNFGYNIGMGALFGGLAGAVGPTIFGEMGGVVSDGFAWSNFIPAVKAGVVVGAAFGGLSTATGGGNFFQNVAFGALGGGMGAAIGFGISAGVAKGWAAVKDWWRSMPGTIARPGSAKSLDGLQFASHDRSDVMSDAPKYAASSEEGISAEKLWSKTYGQVEKLAVVGGAVSMGAALMSGGAYLMGEALVMAPVNPVAAAAVGAIGLVNFLGGVGLEALAGNLTYEFFIKPYQNVPAPASR